MSLRVFLAVTVTLGFGLFGASALAEVPDSVKFNADGPKGAVEFNHKKHAEEYKVKDAKAPCKACHHTLEKDTPDDPAAVKKCSACHVKEGEAQVEHDGKKARFMGVKKGDKYDMKSLVLHQNCLDGCHKQSDNKEIKKCGACHKK